MVETYKTEFTSKPPLPVDDSENDHATFVIRILLITFGCLAVLTIVYLTIYLVFFLKRGSSQRFLAHNTGKHDQHDKGSSSDWLEIAERGNYVNTGQELGKYGGKLLKNQAREVTEKDGETTKKTKKSEGSQHQPAKDATKSFKAGGNSAHYSFGGTILRPLHFSAFSVHFPSFFESNSKEISDKIKEEDSFHGIGQLHKELSGISDTFRPTSSREELPHSSFASHARSAPKMSSHSAETDPREGPEISVTSIEGKNQKTRSRKSTLNLPASRKHSVQLEGDLLPKAGYFHNQEKVSQVIYENKFQSRIKRGMRRLMRFWGARETEKHQGANLDFSPEHPKAEENRTIFLRGRKNSSSTIPAADKVSTWVKKIGDTVVEANNFERDLEVGARSSLGEGSIVTCDLGELKMATNTFENHILGDKILCNTKLLEGSREEFTNNKPKYPSISRHKTQSISQSSSTKYLQKTGSVNGTDFLDCVKRSSKEATLEISSIETQDHPFSTLWERSTDSQTAPSAPGISVENVQSSGPDSEKKYPRTAAVSQMEGTLGFLSDHLTQGKAASQDPNREMFPNTIDRSNNLPEVSKIFEKDPLSSVQNIVGKENKNAVLQLSSLEIPTEGLIVYTADKAAHLSDSPDQMSIFSDSKAKSP